MDALKLATKIVLMYCFCVVSPLQAKMYKNKTFSVKPINYNALNIPLGTRVNTDSRLNGNEFEVYKRAPTYLFTALDNGQRGYTCEVGYLKKQLEYVLRLSIMQNESIDIPHAIGNKAYLFHSRTNLGVGGGLNWYIDINKEWIPYIGFLMGFIFEQDTEVDLFSPPGQAFLGTINLQGHRSRLNGQLVIGADYLFSERFVVSISTGIHYLARPNELVQFFNGFPTTFRENDNEFTVPCVMSLKLIF